jgi:hypothetical protein
VIEFLPLPVKVKSNPRGSSVKLTNCRQSITSTTSQSNANEHRYISVETSTGTSTHNAKGDNNDYQELQKQTTINTRIICRHNYLSTNYSLFKTVCPDLQFG